MFTGITKGIGKIKKVTGTDVLKKVSFVAPSKWSFKKGESVSVSGICSTVVKSTKNIFEVDYMKETLAITTAKFFKENLAVNLEKSLKFGDPLDGHLVSGHVDCTGLIEKIIIDKENKVFEISVPKNIIKYVVHKGSVAVDGVSLTVSKKSTKGFQVSLIPYTISYTTLRNIKKSDKVNIEVDARTKYILK